MTTTRDLDRVIAGWIDEGPSVMPEPLRHAIVTEAPASARLSPGVRWRALQPALALALAIGIGLIAFVVLPREVPPSQVGTTRLAQLEQVEPIEFAYAIPGDIDVTLIPGTYESAGANACHGCIGFTAVGPGIYGWRETDEPASRGRGIVVADVTGDTPHSGGAREVEPLGSDAETFLAGLDAMPQFTVDELSAEEIGALSGPAGMVTWSGEDWSHIDVPRTESPGPSVDFLYPSWVFVADVGERIVLVQVWASTRDELEAWLPDARRIIDSFEFAEVPS